MHGLCVRCIVPAGLLHVSGILIIVVLSIGVRESSVVNNVFTAVNLLVVLFIVVSGLFQSHIENWRIPEDQARKHIVPSIIMGMKELHFEILLIK